jgi:putative sigma-54 modulation protein
MNVEYVGRGYDVDERLKDYTDGKLTKILKFLQEPIEIQVTLAEERHHHTAEIHVTHRHGTVHTRETTVQMVESINLALDKAERQARKAREKFLDKRRRAARNGEAGSQWPVEVVEGGSLRGGEGRRVIKSGSLRIKPMSIEEAALQLEGSRNEFIVFRDADTEKVSVLYKRKDDNYGLIAPEL